ncbi:MAG: leucine-rich repeat protein [Clostridia bacterium]|nr:leucine-rich repeat protein [Clostridia bacterium]
MKSKFKTIMATVLCYLILLSSVPMSVFTVYAEEIPLSGNGTEQFPYLIHTAEEFSYVMRTYGKSANAFISLENDIEITDFTPDVFAAKFDGNYHTIFSDIHFATTNNGVINKLVYENSNPYTNSTYDGVAALCTVNNGTISNTIVTAQITNSWNAAIIAYRGTGSILNCAALGSVTTYDSDGSTAVGIAYSQGKIANCYVAATISASGHSRYGASHEYPISYSAYTDTYFDKTLYTDVEENGYSTEFMKSEDFIDILNSNSQINSTVWAMDSENKNNGYPVLKNAFNADIASSKTNYLIVEAEDIELYFEDGIEVYYTLDGSEPNTSSIRYTTPIEIANDVIITAKGYKNGLSGNSTTFCYGKVDGDGSAEKPYLIDCEADFRAIAELPQYAHYSLTADINLTNNLSTFGDFYGVFEGNGHTVNNLFSVANSYIYGLFQNNYGVIENLNLKNFGKGLYSNGAIAFKNYGVISGCTYQGNLFGKSERTEYNYDRYQNSAPYYYGLGGFVAFNYGVINNSEFIGNLNVQVGNTVGGFVGINDGSIENCLFEGSIDVEDTFFGASYQTSNVISGFTGYNTTHGTIINSTAKTNQIKATVSSYTGTNIYTFCKGTDSVENCLDLFNSAGLSIFYSYLEWGTVNKIEQNLIGTGYSEDNHQHHYTLNMTKPTCTEKGNSAFACDGCDDKFEYEDIPALGHNYIEETVPPTYETEGYTIRTCSRCDLNEKTDIVPQLVSSNGTCGENMTYSLDTGTGILSIRGTGTMTNYSTSNQAPWYNSKDLIKKIIIENGVTSIGAYAFYDFPNLETVEVSASVKSFGTNCFYYYNSSGKKSPLNRTCFSGTLNDWATIDFSGSANPTMHSQNLFIGGQEITELVFAEGLTEIKSNTFNNLKNIVKVIIPDTVETIQRNAFYNCIALTELTMPCSAEICSDDYSFYNCSNIEKLTLTKGTGTMQNYAYNKTPWYDSRSNFSALVLSDGITNISDMAFFGCSNLEYITFPINSYTVGSRAFEGTKWIKNQASADGLYIVDGILLDAPTASGDVIIPNGVTEIADYALYGYGNITSVIIPDSVVKIGDYAFGQSIKKLTIPCSFNNYTEKAFEKCTGLTELVMTKGTGTMPSFSATHLYTPWYYSANTLKNIILEDGITNIGRSVFSGLTKLTDISIPNTVISIENSAFSGDSSLEKLLLPNSVLNINTGAFNNCTALKELTMPCSAVIAEYTTTFGNCTKIEKITLTKGTGTMPSFGGNYKCTPWYISRVNLKELNIEDGIVNIGSNMFFGNTSISTLSLPNSITQIGSSAFYGCTNLKNIEIPENVIAIGIGAFNGCTSLKTIVIPDKVTILEASTFSGCTGLENVKLSKNLESINAGCFSSCGLTDIFIPVTVNNIGSTSFVNCNLLKTAYILNKDCKIFAGATVFPTTATIYGLSGSTAENYATKYKRNFVEIYGACPECSSCDLNRTIVEPTCTKQGFTEYKCNACLHQFISDYVVATGHTIVIDEAVEPTCTHTGLTKGSHCADCGVVLEAQNLVPTVSTAHIIVSDNSIDPTCTEKGITEGAHCSECGKVFVAQKYVDELGHNYESVITKKATCKETGILTYTCTRCQKQYTETIPKNAHTEVIDEAISATCTKEGKTQGSHCSECGTVIIAQKTIPALGHSFSSEWIIDSNNHWHICINCGTAVSNKAAHVFDNACDTDCNICGSTRTTTHNYETKYDVSNHWQECSVCHNKINEASHIFDNACDIDCNICGKIRTVDNHVYDNACDVDCNICGHIRAVGNHIYDNDCDATCNICGYVRSIIHSYQDLWSKDETHHWHECSVCHIKTDIAEHTYDDDCDTTCNYCGYIRAVDPSTKLIKDIQAEKITLIENINGYRDNQSGRFVYSLPEYKNITVTLNDGTTLNMDKDSCAFIIDSQYCYIQYADDTSSWSAGHTYTVPARLCDEEFDIEVEIIENPYTKLTIEQTDDFYLVFEKKDGTIEKQHVISLDSRCGDQGMIGGILKTDKCEFPLVKFYYYAPNNGYAVYEKDVYVKIGDLISNTIDDCYWLKAQSLAHSYISATSMYRWYEKYYNNRIFNGYSINNYELDAVITIASFALVREYASEYKEVDGRWYFCVNKYDVEYALQYMFGLTNIDFTKYSMYDANHPDQIMILGEGWGSGPSQTVLEHKNGKWNLTYKELEVIFPYDYIQFELDDTFTITSIEFVNDTDAAADTEIIIENQKSLIGNEITLSVDISNNVGIAYLKLILEYDTNALELVSTSNTGLLQGSYTESQAINETPYILQWMDANDSTGDGTMVYLTFKVKDNAETGSHCISLRVEEAYNSTFDDVDLFIKNGTIMVCDYLVGDLNGDGEINGKDGILCSQALAGWDIQYSPDAADVNGDGEFNGKDGILLSQYLAGWNVILG